MDNVIHPDDVKVNHHKSKCFLCESSSAYYKYDEQRAETYCTICGAVIIDNRPKSIIPYLKKATNDYYVLEG